MTQNNYEELFPAHAKLFNFLSLVGYTTGEDVLKKMQVFSQDMADSIFNEVISSVGYLEDQGFYVAETEEEKLVLKQYREEVVEKRDLIVAEFKKFMEEIYPATQNLGVESTEEMQNVREQLQKFSTLSMERGKVYMEAKEREYQEALLKLFSPESVVEE